jgi:hypothetical protein
MVNVTPGRIVQINDPDGFWDSFIELAVCSSVKGWRGKGR